MWFIFQASVMVAVAGWLMAIGATTNGLAAGFVGFLAAQMCTIALLKGRRWLDAVRHSWRR